jgi:hypothetical protein
MPVDAIEPPTLDRAIPIPKVGQGCTSVGMDSLRRTVLETLPTGRNPTVFGIL